MNISFTLRCLVCCVTLAAPVSLAQAKDPSVIGKADKSAPQSIATVITTSNSQILNQVPEPSPGSLILIGLGVVALAMKLRKRSQSPV